MVWNKSSSVKDYILDDWVPAKLQEQTLEVHFHEQNEQSSLDAICDQRLNLQYPFARSVVKSVTVIDVVTLVHQNDHPLQKEIIKLSLDVKDFDELTYEPGDTIGILARNSDDEVLVLLNALQLQNKADDWCTLRIRSTCTKKTLKLPLHIPQTTTPRRILRDYLNLRTVIKKQFLRALSECCTDEEERNFLSCLSSKEGSPYYSSLFLEKGLKLVDLLRICSSCRPSLSLLIEQLPRLLPRPYSIASSPYKHKNVIDIIFSILPKNPGITTSMLKRLQTDVDDSTIMESRKVLMYFRETNKFRYTRDEAFSTNQILITIGTGIAPFIGFLEHKSVLSLNKAAEETLGKTWLFIGVASTKCLPMRGSLHGHHSNGILDRYFETFSRDPNMPSRHIQDELKANAKEFVDFLQQPNTNLYVCADGAEISKSIEMAISDCLSSALNINETAARAMTKEFRISGKYREDLWT